MTKYAVLTNDLQFAAANKHEARKRAVAEFLPRQEAFLREMRAMHVPVIHLQLIVPEDDPRSIGIPDDQKFTTGSKGASILEQMFEQEDTVVPKPKDSGFYNTNLEEILHELGVDTVIITGMQTQICVQTTAADAHFRGFEILVPSDGVVSSRPEDTKKALEWMASYCATIETLDKIVGIVKASA